MLNISKNSFRAWLIVFLAALFFFIEFVRINLFNTIAPNLLQHLHINTLQLGELSATYLLANVIFLFPAGIILDKFPTRYVLSTLILMAALLTLSFYQATTFNVARLIMFGSGISGAFCFIGAMRLITQWFSANKIALLSGLLVTMGMLGGFIAQYPMTAFIKYTNNWQSAYQVIMYSEFMLAVLVFIFVRNHLIAQPLDSLGKTFNNIGLAIRNSQTWLAGLYTSLLNFPITLLGAVWGQLYLVQAHQFSKANAAMVTSCLFLGIIFGSPIIGYLSDQLRTRKILMFIGTMLSLITILIIMLLNNIIFPIMCGLFFMLGFVSSTQILGYALVAENAPYNISSASMSIASTIVMSGGTIFQPIFGWILNSSHNETTLNNLVIYSPKSFFYAMLVLPGAFIVSAVIVKFLKEVKLNNK